MAVAPTHSPQTQAGPGPRLLRLNKPYGVLSQFTAQGRWLGLGQYIAVPGVYVAGRLDADSEGLLLLTDDGGLQAHISDPRHKMAKTYWVQVEGLPSDAALAQLAQGVVLRDGPTLPAQVRRMAPPAGLWPRDPPIRVRQHIPDCWLELVLREGRNRQVRRMTAAIGHPTLRLVRAAIGPYDLAGLAPGEWKPLPLPSGWVRSGAARASRSAPVGTSPRPGRPARPGRAGGLSR